MDSTQTFRNSTYPVIGWAAVGVLALAVAAMGIGAFLVPLGPATALVFGAFAAGALAWFTHRAYVRSGVVADDHGVTVVNPVHTWHFKWSEIDRFRATSMLIVYPRTGRPVRVFAVEAANAARMLGRESSADRVATELNRRLVDSQGGDWVSEAPGFAPTAGERAAMRRAALALSVFVTTWIIVRVVISR